MTARVLVVCTANVCRSPVAAALLAARLAGVDDRGADGSLVTSAGTHDLDVRIDPHTLAVAEAVGIDLTAHRRRQIDRHIVATDGADLVITMAREHVRAVVGVEPSAWPRTFTLKELSRRATGASPGALTEGVQDWARRMGTGRLASSMMTADPLDDVADPFGGSRRDHESMVDEVRRHVDVIARLGPWRLPADEEAVTCQGRPA